jgi:predicted metalloprotease
MRWTPGGRSGNLEDRRSQGGAPMGLGMGGGGMRLGLGGIIIVFILSLVFKTDFFSLLSGNPGAPATSSVRQSDPTRDAREERTVQFVSFVLDDAQNTWKQILPAAGAQYSDAKLVLFRNAVASACGTAQSAVGPFYCPADHKVYIDLGFYDDLKSRFGASGDFAQAYVLAHEIGHHVQNLLGIDGQVRRAQRANPRAANELSVRLELQADCLAGVWAHSTNQRNLLEKGDLDQALNAAAAIGDDRLQKMSSGQVRPESFTHGTSQQRAQWLQQGFNSGTVSSCNTFAQ